MFKIDFNVVEELLENVVYEDSNTLYGLQFINESGECIDDVSGYNYDERNEMVNVIKQYNISSINSIRIFKYTDNDEGLELIDEIY